MLENGTSNDVTILLEDGEIKANKDVLMARSSYFFSMLNNDNNYVESQSGVVNLNYAKKAVMHGIVYYLFAGQIDYKTFTIEQLVEMLNHTRMIVIDKLSLGIENHLTSSLGKKEMLVGDLLKGFVLAHRFNLDYMIKPFITAIHMKVKVGYTKSCLEVFQNLTVDVIKTLFLTVDDQVQTATSTESKLCRFYLWYRNEPNSKLMKDEDKREILGTFDLTKLTEDKLLGVRKWNLFTNDDVDKSLVAIIRRLRDEKKDLQNWVTELDMISRVSQKKFELLTYHPSKDPGGKFCFQLQISKIWAPIELKNFWGHPGYHKSLT